MTKITALAAFASLALAIATTAASAQSLTAHSPPSDKATQGPTIDPNMRKSPGRLPDPNDHKTMTNPVESNSGGDHQHHKAGWDLKLNKKI